MEGEAVAVVDTSTLIDFFQAKTAARDAMEHARQKEGMLRYSSVSAFELASGTPAGIDANRRAALGTMASVPVSDEIAERAGIITQALRARGQDIGPADCLIAATALFLNEPVVTRNAKHFKRIDGLRVITY